jgi:N-acetylglucosaminyldiphosphoundecaprenol N-acetyl-beta-D-mannosaminyltransferase
LRYALLGSDQRSCAAFHSRAGDAGHTRAWCSHDKFGTHSVDEWADVLRAQRPDLVLLALDAYKAEVLGALLSARGIPGVIVGVGGGVGMAAGTVAVASGRWEGLGLEWAYRLAHEPRRLWKRYVVEYPQILLPLLRTLWRSTLRRRQSTP